MRNANISGISVIALAVALLVPATAAAATLNRITDTGQINLGYLPDAAPFSSTGAGSAPEGYAIDVCRSVADAVKAKTGLANLKVNFVGTTLAAGIDQVARGQLDILCGSVTDTLARRQQVSFSLPIYSSGIGVILHEDAPSDLTNVLRGREANPGPKWRATVRGGLADHTYAVHEGTVTEEWVRERIAMLGVTATIVPTKTHEEGVKLVESGQADAYFGDRAILFGLASKPEYGDLTVLERYFTLEAIALPVARNDDDFRLVVDTALSDLYRSGEPFKALYASAFGEPSEETMRLFGLIGRQP